MSIKNKLREGIDLHKKATITTALLNKAAQDLHNAYRHLEMAYEHCNDPDLMNQILNVKLLLGQEMSVANGFFEDGQPCVINALISIINDRKNDYGID